MAEAGATAGAGGGVGAAVVKEGKLFKRGGNQIEQRCRSLCVCVSASVSPFVCVRIYILSVCVYTFVCVRIHCITVVRDGISMI